MKTVLFQGSNKAIGDIFFASHPMVHLKKSGYRVIAALEEGLGPDVKKFYHAHTFLDGIEYLPRVTPETLIPYALERGYEPHLFLSNFYRLRGTQFYPLDLWFKNPELPTLDGHDSVSIQVTSTSHWKRPPIPHFKAIISSVCQAGLKCLFVGGKGDEELFLSYYPWAREYCHGEEYWRFGKDTLLQTVANLRSCFATVSFSSWTSYAGCLQGVPAYDLWNLDQWQLYTPVVRVLLGNPIHYLQERFDAPPSPFLFGEIIPRLKDLAKELYPF